MKVQGFMEITGHQALFWEAELFDFLSGSYADEILDFQVSLGRSGTRVSHSDLKKSEIVPVHGTVSERLCNISVQRSGCFRSSQPCTFATVQ